MVGDVEKRRVRQACSRFLSGHAPVLPAVELARVAEWCGADGRFGDVYGKGEVMGELEARFAALLGKEAAVFMPSGTMAQQIALRIWSDRVGVRHVGLHATSHLELHEHRGYAHLHDMRATLLGEAHRPIVAADVEACPERMAVLVTELPLREAGGILPSWDQLEALKSAAETNGVRLHMDGARLWESQAFYAPRTHAEICAGFDSVYVSCYKGLGGLGGAVLAGSSAFVAESRIWLRRHGGNLVTLYPYVASVAMQLDRRLAQMPAYWQRAKELAAAIRAEGLGEVVPEVPHTNMFHLFVRGEPAALDAAHLAFAAKSGLWLSGRFTPARVPGWSWIEVYVGDNALALSNQDVCDALRALRNRTTDARAGT